MSDAQCLTRVLSEIADVASQTLDIDEVFDQVATAVRRLIPFDEMTVVRVVSDERVAFHATTTRGNRDRGALEFPLSAWSPRWRPRLEAHPPIADARLELDPAFPMDVQVIRDGMRSGMWEPFRRGTTFVGGVWLCSHEPSAFTEDHRKYLRPIGAVLGSTVEHWRLWNSERRRQDRLDGIERMLGALAESLDVREVFQRLSTAIQPLLPHDLVNLTEIDLRARTIRITASAGPGNIPVRTDVFPLTEREIEYCLAFAIVQDITKEITPDTERGRLIVESGLRSWLHVPVLLSGQVTGSLSFLHRAPGRYNHEDAEVARRVADRIALTLSHQQLAEEAHTAAAAQERAQRLEATVETLARELESRERSRIVGMSRSWKDALRQVGLVASSDTTVLITGESGTGKEVISSLIHHGSPRAGKPFVAINCAALPESLLESELFGHEKGAFTGAVAMKFGRIEQAAGGTLFLDEIAEMSPLVQAKLLRVLAEREFQRVGGQQTIKADVRVIAATNRDLADRMAQQTFREDLYYRLNVFRIHLRPLRERREDILPLALAFLEDLGRRMGRRHAGLSGAAREWLVAYQWPGNVRELRNTIERAILLCDGGPITPEHLPTPTPIAVPVAATEPGASFPTDGVDLDEVEHGLVQQALAQAKGNKSQAARLLGLTRSQLYTRLEKHRLT